MDKKANTAKDDEDESDTDTDSEEDEEEEEDEADEDIEIADLTNENVMNLRRQIYLTIVSSLTAEEMAHKILKKFSNAYKNVAHMILEACAHERSYRKQYGLLAERLSKIKSEYEDCFDELFVRQYNNIHLLDTNKIRNVSRFFAHLLYSNALDWTVMEFIKLNERDTNPSKRIFIKILFQELSSFMGKNLRLQLFHGNYGTAFSGLFPMGKDANPKDTRFAINFFTTIGLGGLTEEMRAFLKQKHKDMIKQQQLDSSSDDDDDDDDEEEEDSGDDSDSSSHSASSSASSSSAHSAVSSASEKSESKSRKRKRKEREHGDEDQERAKRRKQNERERSKDRDRDEDRQRNRKKRKKERKHEEPQTDDSDDSHRGRAHCERKRRRKKRDSRSRSKSVSRSRSRSRVREKRRPRKSDRSQSRSRSRSGSRGRWAS